MPLTINTNISSLIAQRNMESATKSLNRSLERMSTGYKINHASDNAAGYSIANSWDTQISSLDIATANASTGADMLTTAEDTYSLLTGHLQRIRDLTEQAANGTYGSQSLRAIQSEIHARLQEISRISSNSEFNGIKLMAYVMDGTDAENADCGITANGIDLQVGLYANSNSQIHLDVDLFKNASVSGLFNPFMSDALGGTKTLKEILDRSTTTGSYTETKLNTENSLQIFAAACSGLKYDTANKDFWLRNYSDDAGTETKEMLKYLDSAINDISDRVTKIGAAQNRVTSAIEAIDVQSQNLISSLSTLRDSDVAKESSAYLKAQILQQASATLLSTANQLPSIALNLI